MKYIKTSIHRIHPCKEDKKTSGIKKKRRSRKGDIHEKRTRKTQEKKTIEHKRKEGMKYSKKLVNKAT